MDTVLQTLLVDYRWMLYWALPALLLLLGVGMLRPVLRRAWRERCLRKVLRRLGPECIHGVMVDNGIDGFAYIDRVVVGPDGLTAVTLMRNEGIIFGGEGIDLWTQVVGCTTYKFPNPLNQNRDAVLALQHNLPGTAVQGLVVFTGNVSFPKGKPDVVKLPEEIPAPAEPLAFPETLRSTWERLQTLAVNNAQHYRSDIQLIRGTQSNLRPVIGTALTLSAIALAILALF